MRKLATIMAAASAVLASCTEQPEKSDGAALYGEFCVACHGTSGRGDGPVADSLDRAPADLTAISARNGGVFPMMKVLSDIDGYTRAEEGNLTMPEFGAMMKDQPPVLVDTGDGILTPTPEPLLALTEYLRGLQR